MPSAACAACAATTTRCSARPSIWPPSRRSCRFCNAAACTGSPCSPANTAPAAGTGRSTYVNQALRRATALGFRHILINVGALDADEYDALLDGLERRADGALAAKLTMCTFQETYARPVYGKFMGTTPDNPRADYERRLANFDRARAAGLRVANPGILVGLNPDLGFELLALALHARHLLRARHGGLPVGAAPAADRRPRQPARRGRRRLRATRIDALARHAGREDRPHDARARRHPAPPRPARRRALRRLRGGRALHRKRARASRSSRASSKSSTSARSKRFWASICTPGSSIENFDPPGAV